MATGEIGLQTTTIKNSEFSVSTSGLTYHGSVELASKPREATALLRGFRVSFGGADHMIRRIVCDVYDVQKDTENKKVSYKLLLNMEDDRGNLPEPADSSVDLLFVTEAESGTNGELRWGATNATWSPSGDFSASFTFGERLRSSPAPQVALTRWDLSYGDGVDHFIRDLEVTISSVQVVGESTVRVSGVAKMVDDRAAASTIGWVELLIVGVV